MEAHITFHDTQSNAADKAGEFRDAGFQVALAGPADNTFIRPGQDDTDSEVTDKRWIVLAIGSGLTLVE